MTSGPDDERRQPAEPTFADVMNGFSFDSARAPRRRRGGRRRGQDVEPPGDRTDAPAGRAQVGANQPPAPPTAPIEVGADPGASGGAGAAAVRPYAWTRGRTKSGLE